MPTNRPRHVITETDDVARALDSAAEHWPDAPRERGRLLIRLVEEGGRAVAQRQEEEVARRRARSLANVYAQYLGQVFTHEMKPLEVEILVAELDPVGTAHQLFHIAYDGTVADEQRFTVLGGEADAIAHRMAARFGQGWPLSEAVSACVASLSGPARTLRADDLEVAVLEHGPWRRTFRRVGHDEVARLLGESAPSETAAGPPGANGDRAPASADQPGDENGEPPSSTA